MMSGLRNFFIALFISLLVFGTVGWYVSNVINDTFIKEEIPKPDDGSANGNNTASGGIFVFYHRDTGKEIGTVGLVENPYIKNIKIQKDGYMVTDKSVHPAYSARISEIKKDLVVTGIKKDDLEFHRIDGTVHKDIEDVDTGSYITVKNSNDKLRISLNNEFTALIIGIDSGMSQRNKKIADVPGEDTPGKQEADTIILFNVNGTKKTIMVSPLSRDMKVDAKGYTLRLGAVYSEFGAETMADVVFSYTGLKVDYYCVLNYESVEKIFDILGDVEFNVPGDMFYDPFQHTDDPTTAETSEGETTEEPTTPAPTTTDPDVTEITTNDYERISLTAGTTIEINAGQAIQLFRYGKYDNTRITDTYTGKTKTKMMFNDAAGNADRMKIQVEFLKELLKQKLTMENLFKVKEIYKELIEGIAETNINADEFEDYAKTIFSILSSPELSDKNIRDVVYPAIIERDVNGVHFFEPDVKAAVSLYKEYKKNVNVEISETTTADETDTTDSTNDIDDTE